MTLMLMFDTFLGRFGGERPAPYVTLIGEYLHDLTLNTVTQEHVFVYSLPSTRTIQAEVGLLRGLLVLGCFQAG